MGRTPRSLIDKVQYFENHLAPFQANAVQIGTTEANVTLLGTRTSQARAAYDAQQVARQAAKNATEAFVLAVRAMNEVGQGIIKNIDAMAESTGNPNVYTLAEVAPPATPTDRGDPGTPFDFKVAVGTTGTLETKWKNSNATGAVYLIYRRLGPTGELVYLGGVGAKKFVDDTVPAGTAQVQYQIQAVRSTGKSDWAMFIVNLGMEPGMATVIEGTPAKIAA